MTSGWLLYLAAATSCQAVFALFYGLVLARLSTFAWTGPTCSVHWWRAWYCR